ncbi:MAG: hypothetical protein PHZ19_03650 [Candidatus Thermoplasmatota archaeon]|nr:hypothetical protein [Candidatus Thermoplasmatota archaeon]
MDIEKLKGLNLGAKKCGPGKFEGNYNCDLAEALYDLTMVSGQDEEVGSVAETGLWAGVFRDLSDLNIKEDGQKIVGAIVTEDDQGFFDYETFSNRKKLEQAWKRIVRQMPKGEEW